MFVCRKDDNKQKRLGIAHFYEKYVNKQKEVLNAPRFWLKIKKSRFKSYSIFVRKQPNFRLN